MKPISRTLSVALILLAALAAHAADKGPHFLSEQAIDPIQLLAEPVKPGTPELKTEIDVILKLQETRTPEDIARAKTEERFDVFAFRDAVGDWFNESNLPLTGKLFKKLNGDTSYFASQAKDHWGRPRPPAVDDRVKPILEEDTPGYPSGHSTRGTAFAELLATLIPASRSRIIERGQQIGWDRVIAGVHYPSDVAAGRVLGKAVARRLLENADFQAELAKVKEEIAHASSPQAEPAGAVAR